jgi:hypothetical protein
LSENYNTCQHPSIITSVAGDRYCGECGEADYNFTTRPIELNLTNSDIYDIVISRNTNIQKENQ